MKEKMSLKDLEKVISKSPVQIGEINGQKVIFNPNISYEKAIYICKKVADIVLKQNGTYFPELRDVLIFCFIAKNMTNLPIKQDKDGNLDIEFFYKLMTSEVGKKFRNYFKSDPICNFIVRETRELLNYRKEIYLRTLNSQNKTLENLDSLITEAQSMIKKLSSFADEHKSFIESGAINKMIETLEKTKNKNL